MRGGKIMSYEIIYRQVRKLTPPTARELLEINVYEGQRKLRQNNLSSIETLMKRGEFTTGKIGIAILRHKKNYRLLMNGQHISTLVSNLNITVDVMWEEALCKNDVDVAHYFASFDTLGARNSSNILGAIKVALDLDWPNRILSLVAGATMMADNGRAGMKTPYYLQNLLVKNQSFGNHLLTILRGDANGVCEKRLKFLLRKPIAFAILTTYKIDEGDSLKFWSVVRDGIELKKDDPRKKLRDYLLQTTFCFTHGASSSRKVSTYHELISKCITAWNAYRKGDRTDLKYYRDKPIPRAI